MKSSETDRRRELDSPSVVARGLAHGRERTFRRIAARSVARLLARTLGDAVWLRRSLPPRLAGMYGRLLSGGTAKVVFHSGAAQTAGTRALIVSHDLSASGAPRIVHEVAEVLLEAGHRVTVLSPTDGPFRAQLVSLGVAVLVDPTVLDAGSSTIRAMAAVTDLAICNTVVTAVAVRALAPQLPTFWYIHEVSLLRERLAADPALASTFLLAAGVWAGSEISAAVIRPHRIDVKVLPYGLEPIRQTEPRGPRSAERSSLAIFGSIESRKGQDLAVSAISLLAPAERALLRCVMYGRVLEEDFGARVAAACRVVPEITFGGELDPASYRSALLDCDAVLVSSRDDTLPLVSLDALGAGRVLMCTPTTGTSAYLEDGVTGFVASTCDASGIAAMLSAALSRRDEWTAIGDAGKAVFDRTFSKSAFAAEILHALLDAKVARH